MLDLERVVNVDVAVSGISEVVEDVFLQGNLRFHDECVEVKPPEPDLVSILPSRQH
jgi:hypothetical protein